MLALTCNAAIAMASIVDTQIGALQSPKQANMLTSTVHEHRPYLYNRTLDKATRDTTKKDPKTTDDIYEEVSITVPMVAINNGESGNMGAPKGTAEEAENREHGGMGILKKGVLRSLSLRNMVWVSEISGQDPPDAGERFQGESWVEGSVFKGHLKETTERGTLWGEAEHVSCGK